MIYWIINKVTDLDGSHCLPASNFLQLQIYSKCLYFILTFCLITLWFFLLLSYTNNSEIPMKNDRIRNFLLFLT